MISKSSLALRAAISAALLGVVFSASAANSIRPLPGSQPVVHTCDRQRCYNTPINLAARGVSPAAVMKAGPVGGQRISLALPGSPSCGATFLDISATSWNPGDEATYLTQSGIPVPLGSTHASLTYSANAYLSTSGAVPAIGEAAGYVFAIVRMRRSAPVGPWWVAAQAASTPVSSALDNQPGFWSKSTVATFVDLSELPGGTGVPSGFDVEVVHYVAQEDGFAAQSLVCTGELLITL